MRLAEFKMRLLVFFAGALRKWAGSIEPTADERARRENREVREDRFDGVAALPTESRRAGARSGPPEHWARLVASAPPDHWLDLIRAKAPHLLSPEGELLAANSESASADSESVSAAAHRDAFDGPLGPYGGPRDGALETDSDQRPDVYNNATDEQSTSRQRPRGRRQRPADSTPPVSAAKWLNRLRFRRPKQRSVQVEPQYPGSGTTASAEYGSASSEDDRAAADRESRSRRSDRHDQSRELTSERQRDRNAATSEAAKSVRNASDELNETADGNRNRAIDLAGESRRGPAVAAGQYSLRDDPKAQTSSAASSEATQRKTVDEGRQPRASKVPTIFVERLETNSATARSRSAADTFQNTDLPEQYRRSGELNRELSGDLANSRSASFAEGREDERFPSRVLRALSAERSAGANRYGSASEREPWLARETALRNARRVAVERSRDEATINANARAWSQSHSAESLAKSGTTNAATRGVEHARHRFASTDFAAPALTESSESMWPTLPPSRSFEITDELAALEREAETLRRLDREQRGTLWNA